MKRVSFEVAKAIKETGYPQGTENIAYYNEKGMLIKPNVFNGGKEIADLFKNEGIFIIKNEKRRENLLL